MRTGPLRFFVAAAGLAQKVDDVAWHRFPRGSQIVDDHQPKRRVFCAAGSQPSRDGSAPRHNNGPRLTQPKR